MRILVGWENAAEAETIDLCLNVDDNSAQVTTDAAEFEKKAMSGDQDVLMMALDFPTAEESFPLFTKIREAQPETPIIGAWHQGEIAQAAKFISNGLHSYIIRDANGEFIFLLTSVMRPLRPR